MKLRILYAILLSLGVCAINAQTLKGYEYWTDSDFSNRTFVSSSQADNTFSVDINGQSPGVHLITTRAINSDGVYGAPSCMLYYIPVNRDEKGAMAECEYWIDDDYLNRVVSDANGTDVTKVVDISSLSKGVHFFSFRAKNTQGIYGGVVRSMFYVPEEVGETPLLGGYEYWLDDDYENRKSSFSTNPNVNLSIDLSGLETGVHFFNFRERHSNKQWSAPYRSIFYIGDPETADGKLIAGYRYQFNNITTNVTLPEPQESYTLSNLVIPFPDVTSYTKVSKDCDFAFTPEKVTMYRESDASFNIQFQDVAGDWTMPAFAAFSIKDTVEHAPLPLAEEQTISFEKMLKGDYCAVKMDISASNYYYLRSSQNIDILLYKDDVIYNDVISAEQLKKGTMIGLDEGTYYIIFFNAISDESNAEDVVKVKLSTSPVDWEEVDEKITVGDANGDGVIDIADVTAIQYYIHNGAVNGFNEKAADANGDGLIDITDITTLIYQIHDSTSHSSAKRTVAKKVLGSRNGGADLTLNDVIAKAGEEVLMSVMATGRASGFQFDISVPDGITIKEVLHSANLNKQDDNGEYIFVTQTSTHANGVMRVTCYNGNSEKAVAGEVFLLRLAVDRSVADGDYEIKLNGIVCASIISRINTTEEYLGRLTVGGTETGITDIGRDSAKEAPIYDLQGRKVRTAGKGVYIQNGKKILKR